MKLAIVIPTYQRPDGQTPFYLRRALASIFAQTHRDYRIYVIGDAYDNEDELKNIVHSYPNVFCSNLTEPGERNKYPYGSRQLWCAGGVKAAVTGIEHALADGYKYVCPLDHDDWWAGNHLECINKAIELYDPMFVCTISTWMKSLLPRNYSITNEIVSGFYPVPEGIILSSCCIKYSDTMLRPRDVYAATGVTYPGDADLWKRLSEEMRIKQQQGCLVQFLTCYHEEEGFMLRWRQQSKLHT